MAEFPEESKQRIRDEIIRFRQIDAKYFANAKPYKYLKYVHDLYKDVRYDFIDALMQGAYSFYPHEKNEKKINGHNCTTVIPGLYIYCQELGLNPQICQFFEFRDTLKNEEKEKERDPLSTHHFAVVTEIENKKYLIDPFYHVFGLITTQQEQRWKISGRKGQISRTREFEQVLYYTEEEFANMVERLKEPAESLDVLVAGQQVHKSIMINKTRANQMVYYDDATRDVYTRLYFEQAGIQDKVILQHHLFDEQGEIEKQFMELYVAKNRAWTSLVQGKKIAQIDDTQIRCIRRLLSKVVDYKKQERMYKILQKPEHEKRRESLTELVEGIYVGLSADEKEVITPLIYARTLYESVDTQKEYVYTKGKHEERLRKLIKDQFTAFDKQIKLSSEKYLFTWKFKKSDPKKMNDLREEIEKIDIKREKEKEEIDDLNMTRYINKHVFHRNMDKALFAKEYLAGWSVEEMRLRIEEQGLDWRIGYLGLITDFISFVVEAKDDLALKLFMPSVQEKVRARVERDAATKK